MTNPLAGIMALSGIWLMVSTGVAAFELTVLPGNPAFAGAPAPLTCGAWPAPGATTGGVDTSELPAGDANVPPATGATLLPAGATLTPDEETLLGVETLVPNTATLPLDAAPTPNAEGAVLADGVTPVSGPDGLPLGTAAPLLPKTVTLAW